MGVKLVLIFKINICMNYRFAGQLKNVFVRLVIIYGGTFVYVNFREN